MADTIEKINIIELEINQEDAINEVTELHESIIDLRQDTKKLEQQNKELASTGKQNSKQYQDNAKQIELNKVQVKSLSREYGAQQKIVQDVLRTGERELGTLEKLTLRNKELREELRKLNLETEEGQERQKEITKEIDGNTEVIKENSDSFVQSKMNVGNYTESIENSLPALKNMLTGLRQVTKSAKAFLATPIGLILAAVALAIGALSVGFKKSQLLADEMKVSMKGLGASLDVVIDRISNGMEKAFKRLRGEPVESLKTLGKAIVTNLINRIKAVPEFFVKAFEIITNVIKREGDEAKENLRELRLEFTQFITGLDNEQQEKFVETTRRMTTEIREEAAAMKVLARRSLELREADIILTTEREKLRREVEKSKLAARDELLTMQERLVMQDNAITKEKELLDLELVNAKERAAIMEGELALGKSTAEERQELANLQAEVIRLESTFFTRSKEMATERISLLNQLRAEEQSRIEEKKALLLEEAQITQEFLNNEIEMWKLRNQSIIDSDSELSTDLINAEMQRQMELMNMQIAAAKDSHEAGLISESEYQLQLLTIRTEAQQVILDLEKEFTQQQEELNQESAERIFDYQMIAVENSTGAEFTARRAALDKWHSDQLALTRGNQEEITKLEKAYSSQRKAINKVENMARLDGFAGVMSNIQAIAAEHTVAYKAASTAIIAVDTYKSAIAAFSALAGIPVVGPVLGGLAAAAAITAGGLAIKNVWAIDEKGGAKSVGGVNPGAGAAGAVASSQAAVLTSDGGLVSRDLNTNAKDITKQAFLEAMEEAPMREVLVTDQVTHDQNNQVTREELATV